MHRVSGKTPHTHKPPLPIGSVFMMPTTDAAHAHTANSLQLWPSSRLHVVVSVCTRECAAGTEETEHCMI